MCVQFCSVTVQRAAYEGNIVFNINVSKYNTRFKAGDVPEVIYLTWKIYNKLSKALMAFKRLQGSYRNVI